MKNDTVYCPMFNKGLMMVMRDGSTRLQSNEQLGIEGTSLYCYFIDSRRRRWAGNDEGLFVASVGADRFSPIDAMRGKWIYHVMEDHRHRLWISTYGSGLWMWDGNHFNHFSRKNGLAADIVSYTMEDRHGNIWISTDGAGLCRYDGRRFTSYSRRQGYPDDVAYSAIEDAGGAIWYGTNKGLIRLEPSTGRHQVFSTENGLPDRQFNYNCALLAADGQAYLGGIKGLIAFHPGNYGIRGGSATPVYFTDLEIEGQPVDAGDAGSPLVSSMLTTERIDLPYNHATFALHVAMPAYGERPAFYYRLLPDNKQWVAMGRQDVVSFINLAPGRYTLEVKGVDSYGRTSVRTMIIHIHSPWYLTWWAVICYLLLAVAIGVWLFLRYKARSQRRFEKQKQLFRIQQEKEQYEQKVSFFNEIMHEIRTPLTLIAGPVEAIREKRNHDTALMSELEVVDRNVHRLLSLSEQLLDFQKVPRNRFVLHRGLHDVGQVVREVTAQFVEGIEMAGKQLRFTLPAHALYALVDTEALTKIYSNLLSNALKYAQHNISVTLDGTEQQFVLTVESDGAHIDIENSEKIFETFYRLPTDKATAGIGIGLGLARALAELHGGTLRLDTDVESVNRFVLAIPIGQTMTGEPTTPAQVESVQAEELIRQQEASTPKATVGHSPSGSVAPHRMLIVEDNCEMRTFLAERFQPFFSIVSAANGSEALTLLHGDAHVDIIVSDVMMPVMDGYALCKAVKADDSLCHIPIVLLTAKVGHASQLEGLGAGAEAYVAKPFSFAHLLAQVNSLIANRENIRRYYASTPLATIDAVATNKADEQLGQKIIDAIHVNLSDETLSVERLADLLCVSRSNLYGKIKGIFGLSPVEFIRLVRLKRGAELIATGQYRINEVGTMVGFSTPSYFSKMFQKQFGMSPTEFAESQNPRKEK